jgi:predicted transposase YdaD
MLMFSKSLSVQKSVKWLLIIYSYITKKKEKRWIRKINKKKNHERKEDKQKGKRKKGREQKKQEKAKKKKINEWAGPCRATSACENIVARKKSEI